MKNNDSIDTTNGLMDQSEEVIVESIIEKYLKNYEIYNNQEIQRRKN